MNSSYECGVCAIYFTFVLFLVMSKATKRKHVYQELEEHRLPQPGEMVVRVVSSKGNNLHEIETADGANFLISMPSKFRKNVWVKRGDFILVAPIEEGDKVRTLKYSK